MNHNEKYYKINTLKTVGELVWFAVRTGVVHCEIYWVYWLWESGTYLACIERL